jgi:hypothetical protein
LIAKVKLNDQNVSARVSEQRVLHVQVRFVSFVNNLGMERIRVLKKLMTLKSSKRLILNLLNDVLIAQPRLKKQPDVIIWSVHNAKSTFVGPVRKT